MIPVNAAQRAAGLADWRQNAGNDAASVMGGTYPGAGITIGPAMTFG